MYFSYLNSLHVLNLQNNDLTVIDNNAFHQQIPLYLLSIANLGLPMHSDSWLLRMTELRILDMTGVFFSTLNQLPHEILHSLPTIYTNDVRLCCILSNVEKCYQNYNSNFCKRLLLHKTMGPFLLMTGISILLFSGFTMRLGIKIHLKNKNILKFVLIMTILIYTLISVFYLITHASVDSFLRNRYIMMQLSWMKCNRCKEMSIFLSIGMALSTTSTLILNHIAYKVVTGMAFAEEEHKMQFIGMFLASVVLVVACILAPGVLQGTMSPFSKVGSFCTVIGNQELPQSLAMVAPSALSTVMLIALIHTIGTSFFVWRCVNSSRIDIKIFSSSNDSNHRQICISLAKGMSMSIVVKCLSICQSLAYFSRQPAVIQLTSNLNYSRL